MLSICMNSKCYHQCNLSFVVKLFQQLNITTTSRFFYAKSCCLNTIRFMNYIQ